MAKKQKNIWDNTDMNYTDGSILFYLFCIFPFWLVYKIISKIIKKI
jgi:hypothetical protein